MFDGFTFRSRDGERYTIGKPAHGEALSDGEAAFVLRSLAPGKGSQELRRFWSRYDSPAFVRDLNRFSDHRLYEALVKLIRGPCARLRLYRGQGGARADGASTEKHPEAERIVARVMASRKHVFFEGGTYRLATGAEWLGATRQDRSEHELVPADEARALIGRMAANPHASGDEKAAFGEASALFARRQSPPIVLLRQVRVHDRMAPRGAEPAVTPAQLRKQKAEEGDWIEVEMVYEDGEAYAGLVEITLPDGKKIQTSGDDKGILRLDGLAPGQCQLKMPDRDAATW